VDDQKVVDLLSNERRMATLETKVEALEKIPEQLSSIHTWLIGVAGGLIVALALLVMELAIGYHPSPPSSGQHGVEYVAPH
jgi:hypothetical protein